ncbi:retropepsin-like aspartic protease [Pseudoalteromonas piscicida]|uniref:retropepsin-like aspartic protease n=1 Tax=Pseudoalteromonas piscicida TaxID=43662 RepID=UPI001C977E2A|nr:retropepsin-like aspartic protease [Pseudoalteromonas piscicida]QZO12878.1 retropepsin-like domain-containing protein [Pseudoalteromonas piscicida]
MRAIILSALACTTVGCGITASTAPQSLTLPMKYTEKGHAYVMATLNHTVTHPMILDSAANVGILPVNLKTALALPEDKLSKMDVQGASGSSELVLATIDHTSVGHLAAESLPYVFKDMTRLDVEGVLPGILGHGYMSQYCNVFDFKNNELSLYQGACPSSVTQGLESESFKIDNNFIKLTASFNGEEVDAVLDTGAPTNYINSHLANKLTLTLGEEDISRGLNDQATKKVAIGSLRFSLGGKEIINTESHLSDMPVFEVLGYKDEPFILLGLSNFNDGKLIIDYAENKIYF